MSQRVCVIGSNSFSGSDFIDYLLSLKRFQLLGVSRSAQKGIPFLPDRFFSDSSYHFEQADLNTDLSRLYSLLDEFKPEYIVNFAAQSEVAPSWIYPGDWFQTNTVALTKLANYLKDSSYLKRYVHVSSPEVYGTCQGEVFEDAPLNPSTPYAASKASGDLSLFTFYKNYNFPLVLVRATNVYGPRQQLFKIMPRSIIYMKTGKKIPLHGGGKAQKSFIHVRDVSKGEALIMEHGKLGQIYHLSPSKAYSVRFIVESIAKKLHFSLDDVVDIVQERLGQDAIYRIRSDKARRDLSWSDEISIEQGLDEVICWVEKHLDLIVGSELEYVHKA